MPKRYNIKWRDDDSERLAKAVKNFNAKITRLEKKDPQNKNALPERMSVKQLKELIGTRQDLNREINALQRFTRRGAEEIISVPENDYNLKITKWQKEEMTRRNAVINRKRKQRAIDFQQIEMKQGGEGLGYTVGQFGMGKAEENALKQTTAFTPKMNRADLMKKYIHQLHESQSTYFEKIDEKFRQTYIEQLKLAYDENDISEVIEAIEEMDYKDFYNEIQAGGGVKSELEWAYPSKPGTAEYIGYVEHLHEKWIPDYWEKRFTKYDDDIEI